MDGGSEILASIASLELPGILADQKVTIKTDAVTSDIYIYTTFTLP